MKFRYLKENCMSTDKVKSDPLLTPDNHALLPIDPQYLQLMSVASHNQALVLSSATGLAKSAKVFNVPTLLTTAFAERQALMKEIQAVFPDQKPIDRTGLNMWDDKRCVEWVEKTGKKKLVIAGLWTSVCLCFPVLSALKAGYEVYIVPDASGDGNFETHSMAVERMVQAGATPISMMSYLCELQRDWAREATVPEVLKVIEQHGGALGMAFRWEWELLGLKEGT